MPAVAAKTGDLFLPDLCGVRALFGVVIIGELLAFVLTLTRAGVGPDALSDLALISLYVQWIGMSSAAVLCLARRPLRRLPEVWAVLVSYLLVMAAVIAVCELAWWVVNPVGGAGAGALINLTHRDFVIRTLGISAIVAALALRYFYVQHHWKLRTASEASARIEALQARIRPHFLFNCMNTIASLTRSDPQRAEHAIEDLADLFRASLSDARALGTLGEELELTRRYLRIEALRLGERLRVEWRIDGLPLAARLPRLTLQPLVENAIYHGIEPAAGGGAISIAGAVSAATIELVISNPIAERTSPHHAGNRLAQNNIRERLAAHFGAAGRLLVEAKDDEYRAKLVFPRQGAGDADRDR